jgi:hypothetical protein
MSRMSLLLLGLLASATVAAQVGSDLGATLDADLYASTNDAGFAMDAATAKAAAFDRVASDLARLQLLLAQKRLTADIAVAEARRSAAHGTPQAAQAEAQYISDLNLAVSAYQQARGEAHNAWQQAAYGVRAERDQAANAIQTDGQQDVVAALNGTPLTGGGYGNPYGSWGWAGSTTPGPGGYGYPYGSWGWTGTTPPPSTGGQNLQVMGERGERWMLQFSDGGLVELTRSAGAVSARSLAAGTYLQPVSTNVLLPDGALVEVTKAGAQASARLLSAGTGASYASYTMPAPQAAPEVRVMGETGTRPQTPPHTQTPPSGSQRLSRPPVVSTVPDFLADPSGALALIARFQQTADDARLAYLNDTIAAFRAADESMASAAGLEPPSLHRALTQALGGLRTSCLARHGQYEREVRAAAAALPRA